MQREYENQVDQIIETGHLYANLCIALAISKDPIEASEITKAMAELVRKSWYLQKVLDAYGPYDIAGALTFLINRSRRDSVLVLNGNMQNQQTAGMSYGIGEIPV